MLNIKTLKSITSINIQMKTNAKCSVDSSMETMVIKYDIITFKGKNDT